MGFFDKVKKFAGGKSMATVEVLTIGGKAPTDAVISVSDSVVKGTMKVTANQDCVLLGTNFSVVLRTLDDQGQWGNVTVARGDQKQKQALKAGQVITEAWTINDVDIERYLNNQSYNDMAAVVGHPKIKLVVNCTADVEGSFFDPDADVEVTLGASTAGPVTIKTTVIEGASAEDASFPVTDSVLKGTVVVSARAPCVLAATKYEIRLELNTPTGPVDLLVAQDQTPKLKSDRLSVSFGGTNITFPLKMDRGDKATQTWLVSDINLPAKLAEHGFSDASAAARDPRVKLVVKCIADVESAVDAAAGRTEVRLM